jgi:hypothetical protein
MITAFILAASCGTVCQQQVAVQPYAVQSQVVVPYTFFFVGSSIRQEAIAQQQLRNDPDYAEFEEFKAWKAMRSGQTAGLGSSEQLPATEPVTPVAQHCAKCHGIAVPKGDFYLDGKPGMRAEDITKAIRMVAADHMPKDRKLTREQKNELLQDLLQLEFTEATPAQPPEPVQPPSPSPPGD